MDDIKISISDRGTITLPAKMRKLLGKQLIATMTEDGLLLKPAYVVPIEIYTEDQIKDFDKEEAKLAKILKDKELL